MTTTTKAAAKPNRKKTGATKKGNGAAAASAIPLLANGKTPANLDAMRAALAAYGVTGFDDKPVDVVIAKTREEVGARTKKVKESDLFECDTCGETSTDATDFCPFCGDGDAPVADTGAGATEATTLAKATAAGLDTKKAELEECEAEIVRLQGDVKRNAWNLGKAIATVHEGELWKAKGYGDFAEWVGKETLIARQYAYDLMKLTKEFDVETFVKAGPGKLIPLLAVKDAEKRDELVNQATNGASARTIRTGARAASGKAPAKEKGKNAPAKDDGLTFIGKITKKPEAHAFRSKASGRPVKEWSDGAYVEIEIARDVKLRVALEVSKDGTPTGIYTLFVKAE